MAVAGRQLEFRWPPWRPRRKQQPAPADPSAGEDAGMTAWCAEACAGLGLADLGGKVRVSWNPRMRTTAGRAFWPDGRIELNPKLRDIGADEVSRTLRHELAHLVAYRRCGRRRIAPHGREWREACEDLGIPGERARHSLPFEGRKMERRHVYSCPECSSVVTRVRPIRRAVACYDCCRRYGDGSYDERFRLVKRPAK